jgi:hypothetical protein
MTRVREENKAAEPYWQSFPRMEKLLGAERPPVLAQIEQTCRQLDTILKSGSPQEAARAQTAMNGYARALELYRQLAALRDSALTTSNNQGPGTISKVSGEK